MSLVIYSNGNKKPFNSQRLKLSLQKLRGSLECIPDTSLDQICTNVEVVIPSMISVETLVETIAHVTSIMAGRHENFSFLAARVVLEQLYKTSPANLLDAGYSMLELDLLSWDEYDFIKQHHHELEAAIHHENDLLYDYPGLMCYKEFTTFAGVCQRPQYRKIINCVKYYRHLGLSGVLNWYRLASSSGLKCIRQNKNILCNDKASCSVCGAKSDKNLEAEQYMENYRKRFREKQVQY